MNINLIHLITGRILLLDNSDFILSLKTHASLVCWPLLCTAMVEWFPGFQVYLIFFTWGSWVLCRKEVNHGIMREIKGQRMSLPHVFISLATKAVIFRNISVQ